MYRIFLIIKHNYANAFLWTFIKKIKTYIIFHKFLIYSIKWMVGITSSSITFYFSIVIFSVSVFSITLIIFLGVKLCFLLWSARVLQGPDSVFTEYIASCLLCFVLRSSLSYDISVDLIMLNDKMSFLKYIYEDKWHMEQR